MNSVGRSSSTRGGGFTRVELAASVLAVVFLLALVVAPALAVTKSDSGRAICFNNLRLIGRGVQIWVSDHGRRFPWRTPVAEGGAQFPSLSPGNAWFEYFVLSNELVTPKILACPSDAGVRQARTFDTFLNGGLGNLNFRNNAVSYPVNLDGSADVPGSWLSGDRNLPPQAVGLPCSAGVNNTWAIDQTIPLQSSPLRWTNAVHGFAGHILTSDSSVEYTFTPRMKEIILQQGISDNSMIHFLKAR